MFITNQINSWTQKKKTYLLYPCTTTPITTITTYDHLDLDQTSHNKQDLNQKENRVVNKEKIKPTNEQEELNKRSSVGNVIKLLGVKEIPQRALEAQLNAVRFKNQIKNLKKKTKQKTKREMLLTIYLSL